MSSCLGYYKNTNLKANHNALSKLATSKVQRHEYIATNGMCKKCVDHFGNCCFLCIISNNRI